MTVPQTVSNSASFGSLTDLARGDLDGLRQRHPGELVSGTRRTIMLSLTVVALIASIVGGFSLLDISWTRFFSGFGELGRILGLMMPPSYGTTRRLLIWLHSMGETLGIAFLGTLLAAILAFPLGLLAANNVMPGWLLRFSVRRSLDAVRGVNTLIWALIWINVVGLGPFAGVLAIMTSDLGTFGKLFSEAIEAADTKPSEGITASGGNALHRIRFGLIPSVTPVLISQLLYQMESNTRSATIIGIVGAGGIGQYLTEAIRTLEWQEVSSLVVLVLITVALIDFVSSRLRFAVIGNAHDDGHTT